MVACSPGADATVTAPREPTAPAGRVTEILENGPSAPLGGAVHGPSVLLRDETDDCERPKGQRGQNALVLETAEGEVWERYLETWVRCVYADS